MLIGLIGLFIGLFFGTMIGGYLGIFLTLSDEEAKRLEREVCDTLLDKQNHHV